MFWKKITEIWVFLEKTKMEYWSISHRKTLYKYKKASFFETKYSEMRVFWAGVQNVYGNPVLKIQGRCLKSIEHSAYQKKSRPVWKCWRRRLYLEIGSSEMFQSWSVAGDMLKLSFDPAQKTRDRQNAFVWRGLWGWSYGRLKSCPQSASKRETKSSIPRIPERTHTRHLAVPPR